jgi:hypothetical protein
LLTPDVLVIFDGEGGFSVKERNRMFDRDKFESDLKDLCERHGVAALAAGFVVATQKQPLSIAVSRMAVLPSMKLTPLADALACDIQSLLPAVYATHPEGRVDSSTCTRCGHPRMEHVEGAGRCQHLVSEAPTLYCPCPKFDACA